MTESQILDLGRLEGRYGIAWLYTRRIVVILVICLAVFSFSTYSLISVFSRGSTAYVTNIITYFPCSVAPFGLMAFALWHWIRKSRAVLNIYERGFTYQINGRTDVCRWSEITSIFSEEKAIFSERNRTLVITIERRSGKTIFLTEAIKDIWAVRDIIENKTALNN